MERNLEAIAPFLSKILFWGLIFIVALPLFSFQRPILGFLFRQELVFQIAIEILLVLYLVLIFLDRRYLPKKSIILLAIGAFLFVMGLATMFSQNPPRALFSSWERLTGYLFLIHIFVFFVILGGIIRDRKRWETLLGISVGVSTLATLLAIGSIVQKTETPAGIFSQRAFGSFGNPSFFAGYLIFNIFLGLYLAREARTPPLNRWPSFFFASAFLNTLGLLLTGTRGAFLGLYLGLFLFFALLFFAKKQTSRKRAAIGLVILVLLPFLVFGAGKIFPESDLLKRLTSPSSLFEQGLRNRILTWQIALKALREKPLFGFGPDNFSHAFDKHFNPVLVERIPSAESWFDRAHNIFIDYSVAGGVAGFLAFVFFIFALLFASKKLRQQSFVGGVIFFSLLFAYLIQGLFIFDTFGTYLSLFLIAGFLHFVTLTQDSDRVGRSVSRPHSRSSKILVAVFLLILLPFIIYSFWNYNLKPARAMGYGFLAGQNFVSSHQQFTAAWQKGFSLRNPYTPDLWLEFSSFILETDPYRRRIEISLADFRASLDLAIQTFEELKKDFTLEARYFYQAGRLGNILGGLGEPRYDFVEQNLSKALELSPKRVDIHYELAELERQQGNSAKMIGWLEQARVINEKIPQTHFNLAIAYRNANRLGEAIAELDQAEALGYVGWRKKPSEVSFFIDTYLKAGRHNAKLAELYQVAIIMNPTNLQLYASLATLLRDLGQFEAAAKVAQKMIEIDPNLKADVEKFLKTLKR